MIKKRGLMALHTQLRLLIEQHRNYFPDSLFLQGHQSKRIEEYLREIGELFKEDSPIEDKYFYYGALWYLRKCNSRKS